MSSEKQPGRAWFGNGPLFGTGIAFFAVGVVFTITMPDNIGLGIAFLVLGVVFTASSSRSKKRPDGETPEAGSD